MADQPSLTLRRRIDAAPAKVYAAWTQPAHIVKWMHPNGCDVSVVEMDVRVGGRFWIAMRTPNGEEPQVSGTFREVEPDVKLVYTWAWRETPEQESLVTLTLQPDGGGTLLTLRHERLFDEAVRDSHHDGWSSALDVLERYVA
ncbi:SRPBCC family protein [Paraburkholderia solisilvae]|uniref:Activator of Hsp90 ATPase homologue 1/2-like C-terminal domain-containing protein n=1 Tax=Paraburkholderia solisilvae TaxID=624376 RepID=A0A6J5DH97_9BURK|nr:SRPBCC domain-containing protein [Paraburkholderia solisilvae]CAB3752827.1 hypothetical protein LMG29739_01596 [Paraburkholderia solisilvae]